MAGEGFSGGCECRAVRFRIAGPLGDVLACHCGQCRRMNSSFSVAAEVARSALVISGADRLSWYRSSATAERGFCGTCGAYLIWRPLGGETLYVAMGALDGPTGASIRGHIFVADKPDWYEITDGKPEVPWE